MPAALDLTEEQRLLGRTVRSLLSTTPAERAWPLLCAQVGVAGLTIPEAHGGAGAGAGELAVVATELGRELTPSPLLGSTVLATHALLESGDTGACARLLPALAEGYDTAALAWVDADGRWDPDTAACAAHGPEDATGTVLRGTAHYVLDGDTSGVLLVVARAGPELALYEVNPNSSGVHREHAPGMDTTRRLATVTLTGAPARRLGQGDFRFALRRVRDLGCAVLASEQAGAAQRALELTVAYTKEREQFGRPIGSFQALKHRMAELYVLVETARSAALAAVSAGAPDEGTPTGHNTAAPTESTTAGSAAERERLAAVAQAHCSEALSTVAAEMIQLHGGIGITWEHPAHRYFKRAHASTQLFGRPHEHLARLRLS